MARAREVERVLLRLGWSVAVLGLILGTCLATILSGATAYGSGVNIGLGAERLELARSTSPPEGSAG